MVTTVCDTTYKEEALRVLRNLLTYVGEAWRAHPDETYDFWSAGLRYADELFGQYEGLGPQAEEADTLDLSSAVNDLLEALEELRDLEEDEEGCVNVKTENVAAFEEALDEVKEELAKFD
ncbi:hypothetical protein CB0101_11420 [Synechococcus sp. CB0101]|uniref:hypothetical protein n=1 Tax=Synechococcus sp. CB0101 TaxID=232348 RepID=UPI0004980882|nr:hypothetical protein [Synechococcus sp. CB0101]QCH15450.1 hypothetical protein CB0101_11420 [Synechococcus sp. CB0101]